MPEKLQQGTDSEKEAAAGAGDRPGPVVRIVGTLPATWLSMAQPLRQALEASGAAASLMLERDAAAQQGNRWAAPTALTVALIDSPARVLAQWIASGEAGNALGVLQTWRDSATQLLKLVHQNTDRCLLIDVAEAAQEPHGLVRALSSLHAPLCGMQVEFDTASSPDTLCMALAQHLCTADLVSTELFDELHAASAVIGNGSTAAAEHAENAGPDGPVDRYRALAAAERRCAALESRGATDAEALDAT